MNKKMFIISMACATLLLNANADENLKIVDHSIAFKFVDISKSDINRVVCENGEMGKLVYGKDKEISIQKSDSNAFIKLLPVTTKSNGIVVDSIVNDFNRDVYLECDSKIYSLNLTPKDIPAQTVILVDKTKKLEKVDNVKAKEFEKANSFEKTVLDIIKTVYKEQLPDGYTMDYLNQKTIDFDELSMKFTKVYNGNDYAVYEYLITAKQNIEIDERMFIPHIVKNPLALALTDLTIQKGNQSRLLVVANANADSLTLEDKKKNFEQSYSEYSQKEKEEKQKTLQKSDISQNILDFIGDK